MAVPAVRVTWERLTKEIECTTLAGGEYVTCQYQSGEYVMFYRGAEVCRAWNKKRVYEKLWPYANGRKSWPPAAGNGLNPGQPAPPARKRNPALG